MSFITAIFNKHPKTAEPKREPATTPPAAPAPSKTEKDPFEDQKFFLGDATNPIIFDVGANRGKVIAKYQKLFPAARIFGFEPMPKNIEVLRQRFAAAKNISIHGCAVADSVGMRDFYVTHFHATNSLLPREHDGRRYFPKYADSKTTLPVPVSTLDAIAEQHSLSNVDILKLDIQGGELMALKGAHRLLINRKVDLIYTEAFFISHYTGSPLFHDIAQHLHDLDYTLYRIYKMHHGKNGQLCYCNALFVSKRIRERVIDRQPQEP